MRIKLIYFLKLAIFAFLLTLPPATWAQSVVTNAGDSGPGTLRYVITNTPAGGTITFATNLAGATIMLTSGELLLNQSVTIDASSLPGGIIINGSQSNRIFEVDYNLTTGTTVTLNSLIITNGIAGSSAEGGGILVQGGNLIMNWCTVAGNTANYEGSGAGGGIYLNDASLTMNECTLSWNLSGGVGGAILSLGGTLVLNQCTIASNTVVGGQGEGGAIYAFSGSQMLNQCTVTGNSASVDTGGVYTSSSLNLSNCIVAGNSALHSPADINANNINYGGSNLVQSTFPAGGSGPAPLVGTPNLLPLGNYGGPTLTMPPLPISPVVDAGSDFATNMFAIDQRGLPRLSGPHVDIGAVEGQYSTLMVNNTADSGAGSLRAALANSALYFAIVRFASNLSGQTISLSSGELLVNKYVTIDGFSLAQPVRISGNQASRVFEITNGVAVTLNALTITGGNSSNGYGGGILNSGLLVMNECLLSGNSAINQTNGNAGGGALCNQSQASATLTACTVSANSVYDDYYTFDANGGGIYNAGTLVLNNCTVSGNAASAGAASFANGGGIANTGNLTLNQCTLSGNSSSDVGGGVMVMGGAVMLNQSTVSANSVSMDGGAGGGFFLESGVLNLNNSIVAGNSQGEDSDIFIYSGTSNSTGANLIGQAPLLAALGNYGGYTQTMPPLPGSPAIDASTASSFSTDQRGFPRQLGAAPDLGAVEGTFNPAGPGVLTGVQRLGDGTFHFAFTNYPGMTQSILATTNAGLPLRMWSNLGFAVESPVGSGKFQFTDPVATIYPQRYYRVKSP